MADLPHDPKADLPREPNADSTILRLSPLDLTDRSAASGASRHDAEDAEPLGGDPPCWAHLFEAEDDLPPARG